MTIIMFRGGWYALLLGSLHLYTQWNVFLCILVADITVIIIWNVPIYYFVKWRRDETARKKSKTMPIAEVVSVPPKTNEVDEKEQNDVTPTGSKQ